MDRRRKGLETKEGSIQLMISKDGLPKEERLTDMQIKDNCLALLIAGFATTGAALMWSMKFLEENPCAREKLMVSLYTWKNLYLRIHIYLIKIKDIFLFPQISGRVQED